MSNIALLSQSSSSFRFLNTTSIPWQKRVCPTAAAAVPLRLFSVCKLPPSLVVNGNYVMLENAKMNGKYAWEQEGSMKRREYLVEKIEKKLQIIITESSGKLKFIDEIQRLGIGHHFEDVIDNILQVQCSAFSIEDDLFTTALRFRLLRQAGCHVSPEVFMRFKDKNGKFKESLCRDALGLLSLYEASYTGARGEKILEDAREFTESRLKQSLTELTPRLRGEVGQALEVPRHLRMVRLEARRFIEEYGKQSEHDRELLELATLDYNQIQAQHQMELTEIKRWWMQLGLIDKLSFTRDRPLECFLWTVGLLPDPKYSICRIESAKTIAILLVIDDIFDTYGKMDELILFTDAIRRWNLEAIEILPEYMKICYMALYNTTNEICYRVLKDTGRTVLSYIKSTWIDMIECFMVEVRWFNGGSAPNLEEYIENGVSTAGAYMALVNLFFLIGEGITDQNASLLIKKPYPKLFTTAGRILRLWDDLGTTKEEEERGDLASSIHLFTKEKNLSTEEEVRNCILEEIFRLWEDLNEELVSKDKALPLSIINVALNMARTSQVVYKHELDTYFSNVDNYVEVLFFTPLDSS